MGNTPTQQPFEGDAPAGDGQATGTSLRRRVTDAVGTAVDRLRSRVSVFSALDFGRAFHIEEDPPLPTTPEDEPESEPGLVTTDADEADDALPRRKRPLTQPVRDRSVDNGPDLQATEEDGELSIYYPDREEATITSDTYHRVDR